MKPTNKRLCMMGALLAISLAPVVAAQPADPEAAEGPQESRPPPRMSPDAPHYASGYLFIASDYYNGKSSKEELDARVAAMQQNRSTRRTEEQNGLKLRWGARLLLHPDCREELRRHARLLAFLTRAMLVAQTDPSVKQRAELVARLERIIERQEDRHTKAMERLRATLPDAGSGAPAAPASASAAPGGK